MPHFRTEGLAVSESDKKAWKRKGDYSQPRVEISSKRKKMSTMDPRLTEDSQFFRRFKAAGGTISMPAIVMLTEFESIMPLFEETSNAVHELTLARDIYEYTDILSVKMEYQDSFEQDFFQLKPYYTDVGNILLHIAWIVFYTGPQLLRLLVQNRIAEFHTELELLPSTALENPYIKHAVELEQSMEGAYNRVLNARQTMPHEAYAHFMDLLAKTVSSNGNLLSYIISKDELGLHLLICFANSFVSGMRYLDTVKKTYDYLSINDARQMLLFSSNHQLLEYIKEVYPEWWEIKNSFGVTNVSSLESRVKEAGKVGENPLASFC
ncbi:hypothetical protein SAY87_014522 [Trapa incisa]|uniref:CSN8/PSMD8/EIF3K domain-containing protein n=1 Tax=Trapa incisa TaxID=236973 RepID=A0AAN7JDE6_9MYRT|nr:hypothetical protein SAY87_014522 [Trapa incisa]